MLQGPSSPGMMPVDLVDFQNLLNQVRQQATEGGRKVASAAATPTGTRVAGLAAPALYATGSLMGGDVARGVGELGGGLLGSQLVGGIARGLEEKGGAKGKLLGGAVRLAGGLLGGGIGGGVASALGGGVARAAEAVTGGAARTEMARGQSPSVIPGVGSTGIGFTNDDIAKIEQLSKITGRSQVDIAREMLPIQNEQRNAELQRTMQLAQQTGQITGALNRQTYMAQLAGGAQQQAGDTVRTMLTAANPYAQSAFQARG